MSVETAVATVAGAGVAVGAAAEALDTVTAADLASRGAPYLLAVCVLVLAYVVVRLFNRLMQNSDRERKELLDVLSRVAAVMENCNRHRGG